MTDFEIACLAAQLGAGWDDRDRVLTLPPGRFPSSVLADALSAGVCIRGIRGSVIETDQR